MNRPNGGRNISLVINHSAANKKEYQVCRQIKKKTTQWDQDVIGGVVNRFG